MRRLTLGGTLTYGNSYEATTVQFNLPSVNGCDVLQDSLGSVHSAGINSYGDTAGTANGRGNEDQGRESAVGVTRAPEAGPAYTSKMDNAGQYTDLKEAGLPDGYDTGPVIELWIPTKVRKIA